MGRQSISPRRRPWRPKARRAFNRGIPYRRPGTVGRTFSGGPGEHLVRERNVQRRAERAQCSTRIGKDVFAMDDGRRMTETITLALEQFALRDEADVVERYVLALLHIGDENVFRRADQEGVAHTRDPIARKAI